MSKDRAIIEFSLYDSRAFWEGDDRRSAFCGGYNYRSGKFWRNNGREFTAPTRAQLLRKFRAFVNEAFDKEIQREEKREFYP